MPSHHRSFDSPAIPRPSPGIMIPTLIAALTLVGAACLHAAPNQGGVPEAWRTTIAEVDRKVLAGQWQAAEKTVRKLTREMALELSPRPANRQVLALVLILQAVAEAGLEREEDAVWHWHIAQNLDPSLRRKRLSAYGAGGALLERHRLRLAGELPEELAGGPEATAEEEITSSPGPLTVPAPKAPQQLSRSWDHDPFEVEVVIDREGRIREPVVLKGELPGKIFLGLEALRSWRFEPARSGTEPVATLFVLDEFSPPDSLALGDLLAFRLARDDQLGPIQELVLTHQWTKARAAAHDAIDAKRGIAEGASADGEHLGQLLFLSALTEAGSGNEQGAVWQWHLVRQFPWVFEKPGLADQLLRWNQVSWLFEKVDLLASHRVLSALREAAAGNYRGASRNRIPELIDYFPWLFEKTGLSPYGRPGRLLAANPMRCWDENAGGCDAITPDAAAPVVPPRARVVEMPAMPAHRWPGTAPERLVVRLVVDAEGRPREPRILEGHSGVNAYFALRRLASWRFEPAERDGQPVAAFYELTVPFPAAAEAAVVDGWRQRLAAVDALLLAADWNQARSQADALVAKVAAGVGGGGSDLLARALRSQALAEAGLGEAEAAVWHWQMAQNLAVELRYETLAEYGTAGQLLAPHRLPWPYPFSPPGADGEIPAGDPARPILAAPAPTYPDNVLDFVDGARVEVLVDGSGQVHAPLVVAGRAPGILYPALESLRHWRFAPQAYSSLARYQVMLPPPRNPKAKPRVDKDARALAKAAQEAARDGCHHQAICLWQAGLSLDPQLIKLAPKASDPVARLLTLPAGRWHQPSPRAGRRAGPRYVGGDVRRPRNIYAPDPHYPSKAALAGVAGVIRVQVIIDEEGRVAEAKLLQGLPKGLNAAALKAVCRWRYEPATVDGEPVSVYYNLRLSFGVIRGKEPPLVPPSWDPSMPGGPLRPGGSSPANHY